MVRLHKHMALCGVASRRECERLIANERVTVNGKLAQVGESIDPDTDEVRLDGKPLEPAGHVYVVLNKPTGVVTTASDKHGRKTVLDCVKGIHARLFPVGRLDMDVEGALLLTNDGELAHRLMHPSFGVDKVYLAWVKGTMRTRTASLLERGVQLEDGMTAPANVVILQRGAQSTLIRMTLHEGRKREVKRMCAHVGHPVRELRRISIGNVKVKGLQPGEWRYLSDSEVKQLRLLTQLHSVHGSAHRGTK